MQVTLSVIYFLKKSTESILFSSCHSEHEASKPFSLDFNSQNPNYTNTIHTEVTEKKKKKRRSSTTRIPPPLPQIHHQPTSPFPKSNLPLFSNFNLFIPRFTCHFTVITVLLHNKFCLMILVSVFLGLMQIKKGQMDVNSMCL